jgi:uncharacterized membrane protein YfcA
MNASLSIVAAIAMFCGTMSGTLGSPGFALIIPFLMMSGLFPTFQLALGVYFFGVVIPDLVNALIFTWNNYSTMNFKMNIVFTIVFALFSGLSVYFSKYLKTNHKFYTAGIFQLFIGCWYLINANNYS